MNRFDFQKLAEIRIAEAQALLTQVPSMPDGAYYLSGYAVECALKACISKLVKQDDYPDKTFVNDSYTHNISNLVKLAGLEDDRIAEVKRNPALGQNWIIVKDWNERARYENHTQLAAQKLYDAITDSAQGVLPWIKVRW